MKNKGMTVIELLGSIVVLAIIAIVTIPIIHGIITKIKLGALKDSAYGLVDSATLYYAQYQNGTTDRFDIENSNVINKNTVNNLTFKGEVKQGTVIINNKGQATVCITDGKNSAYKNYNEKEVTLKAGKTCNIPSNTYVVFLDNDRTIEEMSNQELTSVVAELQRQMATKTTKEEVLDATWPIGSVYITTTEDTVAKVEAKLGGTWKVYGKGKTLVGVDSEDADFNKSGNTGGEKTHTLTTSEMPSHTHTFTGTSNQLTGNNNQDHTHSGNTGWVSNDHAHYVSGTTTSNGSHEHSIGTRGSDFVVPHNGGAGQSFPTNGSGTTKSHWVTSTLYAQSSGSHTHDFGAWTGGINANHYHSFTTGGQSGAHNYYFTATGSNSNTGGVNAHNNLQPYVTVYMYKRTA